MQAWSPRLASFDKLQAKRFPNGCITAIELHSARTLSLRLTNSYLRDRHRSSDRRQTAHRNGVLLELHARGSPRLADAQQIA